MSKFEARHVQRSHTIVLNGVPEVVFPLFTPAGEKLWVDDWDPVYLYPASGETQEGMVFSTGHDDETTYESYREMINSWQEKVNSYLASVR